MATPDRMKGRRQTFWLRMTAVAVMCSLVALVVGTMRFARAAEEIKADSRRQLELDTRLRKLQAVLVAVGDAETGRRGYLLTGQREYLAPYTVAVAMMPNLLPGLDGIPLRHTDASQRAATIRRLLQLKFDELAETIRLYDAGRHADAVTLVRTGKGQRHMDDARAEIVKLLAHIRAERDAMTREVAEKNAATRGVALAMVSVLAAGMVLTFVQAMLLSRARARSERQLHSVARDITERKGQDEFERNRPWFERVLRGETVSYELDDTRADPHRHVHVTCIPTWRDGGTVDGFVTGAQDVTHHREETRRLGDLNERDALTGLLNRAGYLRCLTEACAAGGAASTGLLHIDLDHFKPVNDTHGHAAGDELLRQFAQRLQRLVRPTDAIARLGGDEFAVVLTKLREQAHAEIVADKVVSAAGEPFDIGGAWVRIGASVGVAFGAGGDGGWQDLTERADANVCRAKAAGRGQRA